MDRPTEDSAVRFLSLVSHDLRGALGTVRTYAALLRSPRFALDDKVRVAVEVMLRNVDRALSSWNFLAEAWRLDIGGLRLDTRDEDLLPALRMSSEAASATASDWRQRAGGQPQRPDALRVPAPPGGLTRLSANLPVGPGACVPLGDGVWFVYVRSQDG